MKSNDLTKFALLALAGYGIYTYVKSNNALAYVDEVTNYQPQTITTKTPQGDIVEEIINTPEEGINAISRAVANGRTIIRASKTIASEKIPGGTRGVISDNQGRLIGVEVTKVKRDSSGLSEWDRRIIKNIQEAKARGENPKVPDDLKPYVSDF